MPEDKFDIVSLLSKGFRSLYPPSSTYAGKSSDINFDLVNDEMKNYKVHDLSKVGYPDEFLNNIRDGDHVSSYAILGSIKQLFNIKTRSYIGHGSSHAELYFKIKGVLEN